MSKSLNVSKTLSQFTEILQKHQAALRLSFLTPVPKLLLQTHYSREECIAVGVANKPSGFFIGAETRYNEKVLEDITALLKEKAHFKGIFLAVDLGSIGEKSSSGVYLLHNNGQIIWLLSASQGETTPWCSTFSVAQVSHELNQLELFPED